MKFSVFRQHPAEAAKIVAPFCDWFEKAVNCPDSRAG
tara:strand:- start:559 stop:669 length:111 start_codon:yes stop_codon:yes gene_type:complete